MNSMARDVVSVATTGIRTMKIWRRHTKLNHDDSENMLRASLGKCVDNDLLQCNIRIELK